MAGTLKIKELILENADGSSSTSITLGEDGKLNFGNAFSADPLPGSIVQVQYVEDSSKYTITSHDLFGLTNLYIDFTPKYENSMILLQAMINSSETHVSTYGFLKDGVVMSPITNTNSNGSISTTYKGHNSLDYIFNTFIQFKDIAGSKSLRRYQIGAASSWSGTLYNIIINDRNGGDMRSISSLTIFEVKR